MEALARALEVLRALGTALAWTLFALFAVHRWFRWNRGADNRSDY